MGKDKDYIIKIQELEIGDLVTFCGYNYTPDFLIYDEVRDGTLGIVIEKLTSIGTYMGGKPLNKAYRVYWFKSGEKTTELRDYLRLYTNGDVFK